MGASWSLGVRSWPLTVASVAGTLLGGEIVEGNCGLGLRVTEGLEGVPIGRHTVLHFVRQTILESGYKGRFVPLEAGREGTEVGYVGGHGAAVLAKTQEFGLDLIEVVLVPMDLSHNLVLVRLQRIGEAWNRGSRGSGRALRQAVCCCSKWLLARASIVAWKDVIGA